jgi:hypothetical protein
MMRNIAWVLLAANLLFFGWTLMVSDEREPLRAVPAAARTAPLPPPPPPPCTTLGPFVNEVLAERLQRQMEAKGWGVIRRNLSTQVVDGYWVYVGGLTSTGDQERVLRALKRTGMQDAFAMPDDPEFRVSVGIFKEMEGAEDRARRVRVLRLNAVVSERKRDDIVLWLDVPGVDTRTLGNRLAEAGVETIGLKLERCPPAPQPATTPASATAAGTGAQPAR